MTEKRRRKPGEGSVRSYDTSSGRRWLIVYGVRDAATGKRTQKLKRGFTSEKAATKALREHLVKVDSGTYVEPSKQLLRDYLEVWLDGLRLAPSTVASYRKNVRLHVVPRLGGMPLSSLAGTQLTALYRDLEQEGRRDGKGGGLSPRTVRYVHTILHASMRAAVRDGRLAINPADRAVPPSARQALAPEMSTWTGEELRAFLSWSRDAGDDLYVGWHLLAMTGMRRGELLGLRWGDVDFTRGALSVRRSLGLVRHYGQGEEIVEGQPKSGRARVIDLDDQTVAALRSHRARLAELSLLLARDSALVLPRPDGAAQHPERFSRSFTDRLARCRRDLDQQGPPVIRLHDLRHTHATLALTAGVHPKIVSERLGHAKVSITLDTYSHALPTLQREAASKVASIVYGATS